ncbi:MAG TPA: hypothetical protein VIF62_10345, partial [Labilithrix sp.]
MRRAALLFSFLAACGGGSDSSQTPDVTPPTEMTPPTVEVRILAFNDLHGWLEPPDGANGSVDGTASGGAAYLAAHVKALRTANTVVVSSGDLTGASPLVSGLFHDEPTILAMNAMGLDVNGVGNHEFDHGAAELLRLQKGGCHPTDGCTSGQPPFPGAKFAYLAANVDDAAKQTLFPAYAIVNVGGEAIAFVGMTLEQTGAIVPQQGIAGLTFEDEAQTINALVPEIKAKGAVAIVALLHQGDVPPAGTNANGCGIEGGYLDALVSKMDPA